MRKHKTLVIEDSAAKNLVTMKEAITAVERSFRSLGMGRVEMPPKMYLRLDEYGGDFRAMPAYVHDIKSCGIKWVNVHPGNKRKNLPTVMAVIILNDPATGFPLAVMGASYATALRTGAAGAVAAKYLARKNSSSFAFIGCGVQARTQLEGLCEFFDMKEIRIWGIRRAEAEKFAFFTKRVCKNRRLEVYITDIVEECVKESDVVVTTTPSREPLVRRKWLKEGAHINAIGADAKGKEELEPAILKEAKVVVDSWPQASHSGEINVPVARGYFAKKDVYAEIGEIAAGKKKGRTNDREITVFDSTGLAVQDIAIADIIYRKAKNLKKIRQVDLVCGM